MKEGPKKDEPKQDEPKKDEPKKDEPKEKENEEEQEDVESASQRLNTTSNDADVNAHTSSSGCCGKLCETIDAVLDIAIQDGPFLAIRLSTIIVLGSVPDELLFYLAKNGLIIAINIYRIIGNYMEKRGEKNTAY